MMFKEKKNFNPSFITSITEDETYHGNWWLPENPNDKISGVLYLKKTAGIRLTLIGMFQSDASNELGFRLSKHAIILGQNVPGRAPITLINCDESERASPYVNNVSKDATQRFKVESALFGYNIDQVDELKFKGFEFSTTYLVDWMDSGQLELTFKGKDPVITSSPRKEFIVRGDGYEICFASWASTSLGRSPVMTQQASVQVNLDESITLETYKDQFQVPLLNLVQFGSSLLNSVTFTNVLPVGGKDWRKIHLTGEFEQISRASEEVIHYALFRLSEFFDPVDSIASLVSNWIKVHQKLNHVFRLYFDSMYIGSQFPVSKFLNIAQALESFHASHIKSNRMDLRVRLHEMVKEADDIIREIAEDQEILISRSVDTRNYYTHYNANKKIKAAVGLELEALTYTLRIVLIFQFLSACQLEKSKVVDLIKRYPYFNSVKIMVEENNFWQKTTG